MSQDKLEIVKSIQRQGAVGWARFDLGNKRTSNAEYTGFHKKQIQYTLQNFFSRCPLARALCFHRVLGQVAAMTGDGAAWLWMNIGQSSSRNRSAGTKSKCRYPYIAWVWQRSLEEWPIGMAVSCQNDLISMQADQYINQAYKPEDTPP